MKGFRAKDADRDRFVELIEAAYVDGQLGDADRDLRVSRALSAQTVDDLETLTRDLQLPTDYVAPVAAPRSTPQTGRVLGVVVVAAGLVILAIVGVTSLALFVSNGPDAVTSQPVPGTVVESEPFPAAEESQVAEVPSFSMRAGEVRAFTRAYERTFGTLDTYEVGFYPTRVGVQVPVRGSRPRFERWAWTGEWRQDTEASAVIGPGEIIDIGRVDVGRMFDNIATAKKSLNVQRGRLTHVLVNFWIGDVPSVNIYIANKFNESGYLKTTLSGEVLNRFPYDG